MGRGSDQFYDPRDPQSQRLWTEEQLRGSTAAPALGTPQWSSDSPLWDALREAREEDERSAAREEDEWRAALEQEERPSGGP